MYVLNFYIVNIKMGGQVSIETKSKQCICTCPENKKRLKVKNDIKNKKREIKKIKQDIKTYFPKS